MIQIVKATTLDLPEIYRVEKLCFEEGIAYSLEKLKEKFHKSNGRFYVVYMSDTIVSYFWTELWNEDQSNNLRDFVKKSEHCDSNKDVLYIGNVCVVPEFRGHGIAKECMRFMLRELSTVKYAILAVDSDNHAAIHIYENFGFVTLEKIDNYYSPEGKPTKSANIMVARHDEC